jgi:ABC-type branched-subunit amino acid transport system substrate-binding protein
MKYSFPSIGRRKLVLSTCAVTASACLAPINSWSQNSRAASAGKALSITQIVDVSQDQQDVSKDFLIGSRAAWQDINLRGGINGRRVAHQTIETDGSPASVKQALSTALANPECVALSGCVGDRVANQLLEFSRGTDLKIAQVAPWLQNSNADIDDRTFPIFSGRQSQITHALASLSVMGLKELGAVYGSAQSFKSEHLEVERTAAALKLKLQTFQGGANLRALGQKLTAATPGVLLFLGGTPELAEFTQGLEQQSRQRYIVALADINLPVLAQMGAARGTPIIATQPVPLPTSAIPLVRSYRETLTRLFDEPPTSLSLAGFIAARYTYQVLSEIDGPMSRQNVLAAFQERNELDLGGFRVSFDAQRRSGSYVTQSMLARDGRLIG